MLDTFLSLEQLPLLELQTPPVINSIQTHQARLKTVPVTGGNFVIHRRYDTLALTRGQGLAPLFSQSRDCELLPIQIDGNGLAQRQRFLEKMRHANVCGCEGQNPERPGTFCGIVVVLAAEDFSRVDTFPFSFMSLLA